MIINFHCFGKGCSMVANRCKSLLYIAISLFTSYAYAKTIQVAHTVKAFLSDKQKHALTSLGEKIELCSKKEKMNTIILSPTHLKKSKITLKDFKIATMALNYRNYRHCIEDEENTFMYYTLLQYNESTQQNVVDETMTKTILMTLPSHEILEALSHYEVLPKKVKEYFKEHIGSEPFDIIKTSLPVFNAFRK